MSSRGGPASRRRVWTKIVVEVDAGKAEEAAAFLAELTGSGVESRPHEGAGDGARERVTAYLPDDNERERRESELGRFLAPARDGEPSTAPSLVVREPLFEEDWDRAWKSHFQAVQAAPGIVVRPPWEQYLPGPGEKVIVIDPGMAFGTGLHASTRLVLAFLAELYAGRGPACDGAAPGPGRLVLDVGTGTGILAMACALLGARQVIAIDNDLDAVREARENVRSNGLEGTVHTGGQGLEEVEGPFDLITSNIVHDTLVPMAPHFAARLRQGGDLVCAGLLAGAQTESFQRTCGREGLLLREVKEEGEWTALAFTMS